MMALVAGGIAALALWALTKDDKGDAGEGMADTAGTEPAPPPSDAAVAGVPEGQTDIAATGSPAVPVKTDPAPAPPTLTTMSAPTPAGTVDYGGQRLTSMRVATFVGQNSGAGVKI